MAVKPINESVPALAAEAKEISIASKCHQVTICHPELVEGSPVHAHPAKNWGMSYR